MNPARVDASGTQLAWLYLYTVNEAYPGPFRERLARVQKQYKETVVEYYEPGHPISLMVGVL